MEDNLYPVSSEKLFPKSTKTVERQAKEQRAYDKEAPIISETIARLETRVQHYKSLDAVKTVDDPEQCMREIATNKQVAAILELELNKLKGIVRTYGKKK